VTLERSISCVAEPEAEPEAEAEAEEAAPEAEAEPEVGEAEVEPEAEPEAEAEPETGPMAEPGGSVSWFVLYVIPALAGVAIAAGYFTLSWTEQRVPQYDVNPTRWWVKEGGQLSAQLASIHNPPRCAAKIVAPVLVGVALCPVTLAAKPYMASFFWGGLPGNDINDALAAFLAPTGFVYAILFAYA